MECLIKQKYAIVLCCVQHVLSLALSKFLYVCIYYTWLVFNSKSMMMRIKAPHKLLPLVLKHFQPQA